MEILLALQYISLASESMANCIFLYTSVLIGFLVHASNVEARICTVNTFSFGENDLFSANL